MDQKILFLDLDGTLLNDQKEITPGNRRAIGEALERGHRVVVTSGRPLKSSLAQARRLGLAGEGCFVIAYNGAVIYDCSAGTEILRRALERDVLYEVFDEARRRGVYVQTYDREDVVTEPWAAVDNAKRYCAVIGLEHRVIQDVRRDLEGQPVKALLIDYPVAGAAGGYGAMGVHRAGRAGGLLFLQPLFFGDSSPGDEQGRRRGGAVRPSWGGFEKLCFGGGRGQ